MIRNVVMIELRAGADQEKVDELIAAFRRLDCPGTIDYTIGRDAGLREGNWSVAIVADFEGVEAYRGYDADGEHNRLRAELAPLAESVVRCQFELPRTGTGGG